MTASKPLVIDIYYGDQVQDFARTKAFGILGVIHKASEATGFSDKLYEVRRRLATDLGMKWGAYHFFHGAEPVAEADHFLAVAEPDADTLVALDWEDVPHLGAPTAESARIFLERIEERLGRKAVIYSGNVAKEQIKGADAYLGSHRLWLCQYGPAWRVQQSWERPRVLPKNRDQLGPRAPHIPRPPGPRAHNCPVRP